jgi:hypothetical protein
MISVIYESKTEENILYVKAVVEDMICVFSGTRYDPPEYGPGLCETSIELEEDDIVPDNDDDLINFLEERNVDWKVIEIEEI